MCANSVDPSDQYGIRNVIIDRDYGNQTVTKDYNIRSDYYKKEEINIVLLYKIISRINLDIIIYITHVIPLDSSDML